MDSRSYTTPIMPTARQMRHLVRTVNRARRESTARFVYLRDGYKARTLSFDEHQEFRLEEHMRKVFASRSIKKELSFSSNHSMSE